MYKPQHPFTIAFVLYRPEPNLISRIELIARLGYTAYIFDNSPYENQSIDQIKQIGEIRYFTAGKNIGLGYSLSLLCATAYSDGWERLLFLDQDTRISEQTLNFIEKFSLKYPDLAALKYSAIVFDAKTLKTNTDIVDVDLAISSGSLFILSNLKLIGWHNERYFVDCVDYEFCLRSKVKGYKIGICHSTPEFDHVSEQPDRKINMLGRTLPVRRYAWLRIKDATQGYQRLICYCLKQRQITFFITIMRSFAIYLLGQFFARITKGN
jgi:rhamnosyltransferase